MGIFGVLVMGYTGAALIGWSVVSLDVSSLTSIHWILGDCV